MRYASRAAVVAGLSAQTGLTTVQVEHCWPGDQQAAESIWLNPSQAVSITIPSFRGPADASTPIVYDDTFAIPVEILKRDGATPELAESRVLEMCGAVIAWVAAHPDLGTFTKPAGWQIIDAIVADIDGPGTARGRNGVQSYASVVVHVHARKS